MNVLILTPDAVGSTLLQRLITIYMQFHDYDRPVINLHELTNGLVKYYNNALELEVLGKKQGAWGYHQTLEHITTLLQEADHYKTSRLAHYHIRNRQDPIGDQVQFYQYLNDNFYIISCRRHNLFEHALSWCLSKITKKLNVYTAGEKVSSFFDLYANGIDIDPNSLVNTLNSYKDYVHWCDAHFNVANYFYYEEHLPHIENYILNLPIFPQQRPCLTWKENFGISFNDWNKCHYLASDIGTVALNSPEQFSQLESKSTAELLETESVLIKSYNNVKTAEWPTISSMTDYNNLPQHIRTEVEQIHKISVAVKNPSQQCLFELLPAGHQEFINQHKKSYDQTLSQIDNMVSLGVMISAPPIKKQTLAEKKHMIRNYHKLILVYNQWIEKNPVFGNSLDEQVLDRFAELETASWQPNSSAIALGPQQTVD